MSNRLEGKVALITGGASGIGECIARLFHKQGAKVCIADLQDSLGQIVCESLDGESNACFVLCDVTNEEDVSHAVDFTVKKFGTVDILVNNAGVVGSKVIDIRNADFNEFKKVVDVNLNGAFLGMKHAARIMIPRAPPPQAVNSTPVPWSTGLCDCCDDVETCITTCFCPCITFGRIAEITDKGTTPCEVSAVLYAMICCLTGCHWIYSCFYRAKMRQAFFLEDSPCPDCLLHFCCDTCALCQEYRELKNRGFDVDLGWAGNVQRGTGAMVPPVVEGGMIRDQNMQ